MSSRIDFPPNCGGVRLAAVPACSVVTCTLGELLALLSGNRDHLKDD